MKQLHEIAAEAAARFKRLLARATRKRLSDLSDAELADEQIRLLCEIAHEAFDLGYDLGRETPKIERRILKHARRLGEAMWEEAWRSSREVR
jgi:hypothetical protein